MNPKEGEFMKRGSKLWSIWNAIEAVLLMVAGVLCIVYSGNSSLQNAVITVLAVFIIIDGSLRILVNMLFVFTAAEENLLTYNAATTGAIELAFGITLLVIDPTFILQFIINYLGIILVVAGASFLIFSILLIVKKYYFNFIKIVGIVAGLAVMAIGILILVYVKNSGLMMAMLIILGIVLIFAGIGEGALVGAVVTGHVDSWKKKDSKKKEAIEAKITEAKPADAAEEAKPTDEKK